MNENLKRWVALYPEMADIILSPPMRDVFAHITPHDPIEEEWNQIVKRLRAESGSSTGLERRRSQINHPDRTS